VFSTRAVTALLPVASKKRPYLLRRLEGCTEAPGNHRIMVGGSSFSLPLTGTVTMS
jgi:hypothetical protein